MQRGFIENSNAPDNQKRIEHQKLNALLGLCEAASCRRQVVLDYFGDASNPCGNCDTCMEPPTTFDGTLAAQKALSAVYRTGQRFGANYVIEVLLGKADDRMRQFGHDTLGVFGIGSEFGKQEWQSIIRQLVAQNLLAVDITAHGGLKITPNGHSFLKEKRELALRRYTGKPSAKTRSVARTMAVELNDGSDQHLFTALKSKRLQLSKAENVPPYVIFHDKTLREMAVKKPASMEDLFDISGVGESKQKRYGQAFLEVIAEFA
jgi:ATP-dependent DNA helicase RecQ